MSSYQYRKSHCGDKTVIKSSYLHNGISSTDKMTSLYWIKALAPINEDHMCTIFKWVAETSLRDKRTRIVVPAMAARWLFTATYRQTSNIRFNLAGNKTVDHSDVVRASPVGAAPTTSSFSKTPGFNGLNRDNGKTRRESFKFWGLVRLILEILRYLKILCQYCKEW